MIVLERLEVEVFSSAVTESVASPVPELSDNFSQEASEDTVQGWLDIIEMDLLSPLEVKVIVVGVISK